MPVEIGLETYGERELLLPHFTGHVARGLLLHMVGRVDPGASQRLHAPNVVKPYSVTPLRFKSRAKSKGGYLLDPAFPCRVRFRFLKDEYAGYVVDFFKQWNTVAIRDTTLHIASLAVKMKSYEEMEREAEPVDAFRLVFRTPTYLASLGSSYHWMFPDPVRIFSGLTRLWDEFSTGKRFSKEEFLEYKEWLEKNVGVAEHELKTRLAYMGRKKATGFVGWTTYEMKVGDEWNKTTGMLARFAEYSNIGGNRTGGFGVTKFIYKTLTHISL